MKYICVEAKAKENEPIYSNNIYREAPNSNDNGNSNNKGKSVSKKKTFLFDIMHGMHRVNERISKQSKQTDEWFDVNQ